MKPRKQFENLDPEECITHLDTDTDMFVPEMSMPVEQILAQFAFVDGVRLQDMMKRGYSEVDDDSVFDYPDFDSLDIAEKEALYHDSKEFIHKYESMKQQASQAEKSSES